MHDLSRYGAYFRSLNAVTAHAHNETSKVVSKGLMKKLRETFGESCLWEILAGRMYDKPPLESSL